MEERRRSGFEWGTLITGVLLLLAAFIVMRYPIATLATMTFIFATVAIIRGIASVASGISIRRVSSRIAWVPLIVGIIDIVIGIIFLVNPKVGITTLTYLFAIWFLIDTLGELFTVGTLRSIGTGWFVLALILELITLVLAVLMLLQPMLASFTLVTLLGWFFGLFGILEIFLAFAHQRL